MNKNLVYGLLIVGGFIGVIALINSLNQDYQWYKGYNISDDEPYNVSILYELLEEKENFKSLHEPLYISLPKIKDNKNVYFLLANQVHLNDQEEIDSLMSFIERGNDAFIAFDYPQYSYGYVNEEEEEDEYQYLDRQIGELLNVNIDYRELDTITAAINNQHSFSFVKKKVSLENGKRDLRPEQDRYYHVMDYANESTPKGYFNDEINYLKIPKGKGHIYFYTTPVLLTNYCLVQENGFEYAQAVLSELLSSKSIVWDHINRSYHSHNRYRSKRKDHKIKSPFSFIFENRSLKLAYFSIIICTVLFILFYARRKQRSIPIVLGKKNSSVEFAKTIGLLYLQNNNHQHIVRYQMKYFLLYIRSNYRLQLRDDLAYFCRSLSSRSLVDEEEITQLFELYQSFKSKTKLSDEELLSFNKAINYFYSNCK